MTAPIRYGLDITGQNVDNVVLGEIHELSNKDIRAFAPVYGPFFSASIFLFDHITGRRLDRGVDYQCVELFQEATRKVGKEIVEVILIINKSVSSTVRINYQVLGGHYQNTTVGIANMFETVMNDNRGIDWINILNKPLDFNPSIHKHLLDDIVGFEPVVTALERIRNAIVLSDVPAFEALMVWVKSQILPIVTKRDIDNQLPVNKLVTFERLLYALNVLNFNAVKLTPNITGTSNNITTDFNISTTNIIDGIKLYWSILHDGTTNADFHIFEGIVEIKGNEGKFSLTTSKTISKNGPKSFKVAIRSNSTSGPILTTTQSILISDESFASVADMLTACCFFNPTIGISPESLFLTRNSEC